MKKYLTIITAFCFAIILTFSVFAANSANIGGDDIAADDEKIQTVPVYISNNPGIMGYMISVIYPKGAEIKKIGRGTLCEKGSFDTTLENHKDNSIDIVWNNTENIKEDGSLFVLSIKAPKSTIGKEIEFKFSQEDTFNESWQDVSLFCTSISIVSGEQIEESNSFSENISDKDYDYIKTVIETEEENLNIDNLENLNDEQQKALTDAVSEKLNGIEIKDVSDVKDLYKKTLQNEFASSVLAEVEPETIKKIIQEALKENGYKDFESVNEEAKKKINETVIEKLKKEYPDLDPDSLDDDSKFESLKYLNESADQIIEKKKPETTKKTKVVIVSVVAGIILLIAAVAVIIIVIKKKQVKSK